MRHGCVRDIDGASSAAAAERKMNVVRRQKIMRQQELTSLLLTKAEDTETANVNAAWAKVKALEAKLEADELKAMSRADLDSEKWNMLAERKKCKPNCKLLSGHQWRRRIHLKNKGIRKRKGQAHY